MTRPIAKESMTQAAFAAFGDVIDTSGASDDEGRPGQACAVRTASGQVVSFQRNTLRGALTPLVAPGIFAVIERIREDPTLEEHRFDTPFSVELVTEPASAGLA